MADEKPPVPAGMSSNEGIAAGAPTAPAAEPMTVPPIPLDAKAKPKLTVPPVAGKKDGEVKDSFRELIETVVFVVVLVLMLKTFLAEAFVIPTGSMATTLLGYHHKVNCQQCGKPLFGNASYEAEPKDDRIYQVKSIRCENCAFENQIRGGQP